MTDLVKALRDVDLYLQPSEREAAADEIERLREIIDRERDVLCMYGTDKTRAALKEKQWPDEEISF